MEPTTLVFLTLAYTTPEGCWDAAYYLNQNLGIQFYTICHQVTQEEYDAFMDVKPQVMPHTFDGDADSKSE